MTHIRLFAGLVIATLIASPALQATPVTILDGYVQSSVGPIGSAITDTDSLTGLSGTASDTTSVGGLGSGLTGLATSTYAVTNDASGLSVELTTESFSGSQNPTNAGNFFSIHFMLAEAATYAFTGEFRFFAMATTSAALVSGGSALYAEQEQSNNFQTKHEFNGLAEGTLSNVVSGSPTGVLSAGEYFILVGVFQQQIGGVIDGNWTLQIEVDDSTPSVPDTGRTAVMLTGAICVLGAMRRRQTR